MSFFHGFGKAMFYGGIFVAGYAVSSYVNKDIRYDVIRYDKKPFLVDKKLSERVEIITEGGKLQLGNLEYRIKCLVEDDKLKETLNNLKNKWGEK
jgi:hypothetical protein